MSNNKGMLVLIIGAIFLTATAAVFFLEIPSPEQGEWLGFGLLVFTEITTFGSLFWARRSRLERPYKMGIYAVLAVYTVLAVFIAVFFGFILPVGIRRFMSWTVILVSAAATLILLLRGAGTRYIGNKRG